MPTTEETIEVRIGDIEAPPVQPREEFNADKLARLTQSLQQDDLLQPIGVRPAPEGCAKRWQLLWGERRLRAAKRAGWTKITARIRDVSDAEALKLIGAENLNRDDWNAIEKAQYLSLLNKPLRDGGAGMTHKQIGEQFGHSQPWATNLIRLLELPPDWQRRLASGELSEKKGRELLCYKDAPHVLAAIADDMQSRPELWRSSEDFKGRAQFIAQQFARFEREDLDDDLVYGDGQPQRRRPAERNAASPPATSRRMPGRFEKYLPVVEPFRNNLKALQLLRDLIDQLIRELERGAA